MHENEFRGIYMDDCGNIDTDANSLTSIAQILAILTLYFYF